MNDPRAPDAPSGASSSGQRPTAGKAGRITLLEIALIVLGLLVAATLYALS